MNSEISSEENSEIISELMSEMMSEFRHQFTDDFRHDFRDIFFRPAEISNGIARFCAYCLRSPVGSAKFMFTLEQTYHKHMRMYWDAHVFFGKRPRNAINICDECCGKILLYP